MATPILHHYGMSTYANKIRLALGAKGIAWRGVETPMVLPKPDHVELTGGYRRVPVLQLGADLYCDSHLIIERLDALEPERPLLHPGRDVEIAALGRWIETSFMMLINAYFGLGDIFPKEFIDDRTKTMVPPGTDVSQAPLILGTKLAQIQHILARLDGHLADGRPFLFGDAVSAADLCAHPLLALATHPRTLALTEPYPRAAEWLGRVQAIGDGETETIDVADAIAEARKATPAPFTGDPFWPDGMQEGTPVVVLHDEYGSGTVTGTLAPSDLHSVSIRRQAERAGELVVHFPREDFTVIATG